MAHRLPMPGDHVKAKPGYDIADGERGVVIRADPPGPQHRSTVRWADGGEQYIGSALLDITWENIVDTDHGPMALPKGHDDCPECEGVGWLSVNPEIVGDTVLGRLGVEPCFECGDEMGVSEWYERCRAEISAVVR